MCVYVSYYCLGVYCLLSHYYVRAPQLNKEGCRDEWCWRGITRGTWCSNSPYIPRNTHRCRQTSTLIVIPPPLPLLISVSLKLTNIRAHTHTVYIHRTKGLTYWERLEERVRESGKVWYTQWIAFGVAGNGSNWNKDEAGGGGEGRSGGIKRRWREEGKEPEIREWEQGKTEIQKGN